MIKKCFYSCGKLLITGEYFILDGALGLALPTRYGQLMNIYFLKKSSNLIWKSFDKNSNLWFKALFKIPSLDIIEFTDAKTVFLLKKILESAKKMQKKFLLKKTGILVENYLEFPKNWGLGSSSTLISNIAKWAEVDPYKLLWNSFSGSGYDIACSIYKKHILYRIYKNHPKIFFINFNPQFKNYLYFIFLNKKKDSNEAIKFYKKKIFIILKILLKKYL